MINLGRTLMIVVVGEYRLEVLAIHSDKIFRKHLIIQMDFNWFLVLINWSWKVRKNILFSSSFFFNLNIFRL
jgi:hypothetical protein